MLFEDYELFLDINDLEKRLKYYYQINSLGKINYYEWVNFIGKYHRSKEKHTLMGVSLEFEIISDDTNIFRFIFPTKRKHKYIEYIG